MEAQSISSILNPVATEETAKASDYLGKEDFLELLIAQLKNQNPLEPLEDSEFIAQMTQFSSLEQLQNMNDTLGQNVQWDMLMSQTITNTMATSLIGRQVEATASNFTIGEDSVPQIRFTTGEYAAEGVISIHAADGTLVRTISVNALAAGDNAMEWDGKDSLGNDLAQGSYTFSLELTSADGTPVEAEGTISGTVTGVKYVQGQAYLDIDGTLLPLSEVREISEG